MTRLPIIGLTADLGETIARPGRPSLPRYELKQAYCDAIISAGALPLILPYVGDSSDMSAISTLIGLCDGLVVTGGAFDIPPALYGETAHAALGVQKPTRTHFEQQLLRAALGADLPLLGVCGGMQLLAVELGATLVQDIGSERPSAMNHEQPDDSREPAHTVNVEPDSLLSRITGASQLRVNSTHHQAVLSSGRATISGVAPDGVVEAIEGRGRFVLGVQWHPELLSDAASSAIYRAFVQAAAERRRA